MKSMMMFASILMLMVGFMFPITAHAMGSEIAGASAEKTDSWEGMTHEGDSMEASDEHPMMHMDDDEDDPVKKEMIPVDDGHDKGGY